MALLLLRQMPVIGHDVHTPENVFFFFFFCNVQFVHGMIFQNQYVLSIDSCYFNIYVFSLLYGQCLLQSFSERSTYRFYTLILPHNSDLKAVSNKTPHSTTLKHTIKLCNFSDPYMTEVNS